MSSIAAANNSCSSDTKPDGTIESTNSRALDLAQAIGNWPKKAPEVSAPHTGMLVCGSSLWHVVETCMYAGGILPLHPSSWAGRADSQGCV